MKKMKSQDLVLIIHHHHQVHVDQHGIIWVSSIMGRWINALAPLLKEIRLLLHESSTKQPQQDTRITNSNVVCYSLGPPIRLRNVSALARTYKKIGALAGIGADILLIRGITPHQMRAWYSVNTPQKIFLLVGQLFSAKPRILDFPGWIAYAFGILRRLEIRRMLHADTRIIANSPVLVSEIERMYHFRAEFIPTNSIRADELSELVTRPLKDPARLLYCGRLDFKKGLRELIKALALLNNQGIQCELDVVAHKQDPIYSELTSLAENLNISCYVNWHGLVPYGEELFTYYRNADVLVLPSYTEGFPHVLWEAAGNCCPIITTPVGGIPAILSDEKDCLMVEPKEPQALAESIQRILSDQRLRKKLITEAHHLAEKYTVEACAIRLVNYFESNL